MNDELDTLLNRLSDRGPHPGLDATTGAVLDRIGSIRPRASLPVAGALAAALAIGVGMASGWSERADARATPPLYAGQSLAPATLLDGG